MITDDLEKGSKIKLDPLIEDLLEADTSLNEIITAAPGGARQVGGGGPFPIPEIIHHVGAQPTGASLRPAVQYKQPVVKVFLAICSASVFLS